MSFFNEIALAAEIAVAPHRTRRLALARTRIALIVEESHRFIQLQPCDEALRSIDEGAVPVMAEHWASTGGWLIENQLGEVKEGRFVGDDLELVIEFSHNPRGRWVYEDLRAGMSSIGCSTSTWDMATQRATPPAPLEKTFEVCDFWRLREVTILPLPMCRDRSATVRTSANIEDLLAEMAALRQVREEGRARALPALYASPLRQHVPRIVDAALAAGGDRAAVEAAIAGEVERWISNWRGDG